MSQPHDGEEAFIQTYLAPLAAGHPGTFGLADDCAALTIEPGLDLVVKTDPIAAGVHFLPDDPPEDIGWKALAVNVSDLAAKGAKPLAYVMALSFPEPPAPAWMAAFASGLAQAQQAFGMHLVGGDTDRRPGPVTISVTAFGTVARGRMVRRATAKPGDVLFVTGRLGSATLGLALLQTPELGRQLRLTASETADVIARYRRPQPRLALGDVLLTQASAAMDLSDGLAKDCGRLCRASGCGAEIETSALALDGAVAKAVQHDPGRWRDVLATGDDYEILLAVPEERVARFNAAVTAAALPFEVRAIGRLVSSGGVRIRDASGSELRFARPGYDHFIP